MQEILKDCINFKKSIYDLEAYFDENFSISDLGLIKQYLIENDQFAEDFIYYYPNLHSLIDKQPLTDIISEILMIMAEKCAPKEIILEIQSSITCCEKSNFFKLYYSMLLCVIQRSYELFTSSIVDNFLEVIIDTINRNNLEDLPLCIILQILKEIKNYPSNAHYKKSRKIYFLILPSLSLDSYLPLEFINIKLYSKIVDLNSSVINKIYINKEFNENKIESYSLLLYKHLNEAIPFVLSHEYRLNTMCRYIAMLFKMNKECSIFSDWFALIPSESMKIYYSEKDLYGYETLFTFMLSIIYNSKRETYLENNTKIDNFLNIFKTSDLYKLLVKILPTSNKDYIFNKLDLFFVKRLSEEKNNPFNSEIVRYLTSYYESIKTIPGNLENLLAPYTLTVHVISSLDKSSTEELSRVINKLSDKLEKLLKNYEGEEKSKMNLYKFQLSTLKNITKKF